MISERTWNDCEIYFPKVHRRFLSSQKNNWLDAYPWYGFFKELLNGQLVLYIKIRD